MHYLQGWTYGLADGHGGRRQRGTRPTHALFGRVGAHRTRAVTLPPSEYLLTFAFFCHRPFQFSQTETVLSLLSAFGLKLYCLSSAHLSDDPKLVDKEIVKSPLRSRWQA